LILIAALFLILLIVWVVRRIVRRTRRALRARAEARRRKQADTRTPDIRLAASAGGKANEPRAAGGRATR
jgi:uncharacterized membrane-anchored protein